MYDGKLPPRVARVMTATVPRRPKAPSRADDEPPRAWPRVKGHRPGTALGPDRARSPAVRGAGGHDVKLGPGQPDIEKTASCWGPIPRGVAGSVSVSSRGRREAQEGPERIGVAVIPPGRWPHVGDGSVRVAAPSVRRDTRGLREQLGAGRAEVHVGLPEPSAGGGVLGRPRGREHLAQPSAGVRSRGSETRERGRSWSHACEDRATGTMRGHGGSRGRSRSRQNPSNRHARAVRRRASVVRCATPPAARVAHKLHPVRCKTATRARVKRAPVAGRATTSRVPT